MVATLDLRVEVVGCPLCAGTAGPRASLPLSCWPGVDALIVSTNYAMT